MLNTNQFKAVEEGLAQNENFVLRYMLLDKPYEVYPTVLKNTFSQLFNMNMPMQDDIPRMFDFLMFCNEFSMQSRFKNENDIETENIKQMILLQLLSEQDNLKKAFSKVKKGDTVDLNELSDELKNIMKEFVIYHVQYVLKQMRGEDGVEDYNRESFSNASFSVWPSYIRDLEFPTDIVDDVTQELVTSLGAYSRILDQESFKNWFNGLVHETVTSKLNGYAQFFEFRENGAESLLNFSLKVMQNIRSNAIVLTENSVSKFVDLMIATIYIAQKENLDDTHQFVANFIVQAVFPNRLLIGEQRFHTLVSKLFKLFSVNVTKEIYQAGRQLIIAYLFPEESYTQSKHRRYLLEKIYNLKKFTKFNQMNGHSYQKFKEANTLYVVDLLWTTTKTDFQLADDDFQHIMSNFDQIYRFDSQKARILDYCDKFFNVSNEMIDKYFEIYHSFYNVCLISVVEWNAVLHVTEEMFTDNLEKFLVLIKSQNIDIDDFHFNVSNFYLPFKFMSLANNIEFFKKHDNTFLRNDATKLDQPTTEFLTSQHEVMSLLAAWKDNKGDGNNTKLFEFSMLNGAVIRKEDVVSQMQKKNADNFQLFI